MTAISCSNNQNDNLYLTFAIYIIVNGSFMDTIYFLPVIKQQYRNCSFESTIIYVWVTLIVLITGNQVTSNNAHTATKIIFTFITNINKYAVT